MGQNFVFGDYHGNFDYESHYLSKKAFPENATLSDEDVMFFLGDFALPWYYAPQGEQLKKERKGFRPLANLKPTIFVVLGNHENYDLVEKMPTIEKFGGRLKVFENEFAKIYYALRGEIYTVNGKTFFTFGGAQSSDIAERVSYEDFLRGYKVLPKYRYGEYKGKRNVKLNLSKVNYWPQEIFSSEEREFALKNLEAHNWKVDFVLTHTAPESILLAMIDKFDQEGNAKAESRVRKKMSDPTTIFLEEVKQKLSCDAWYFGHLHFNASLVDENMTFTCHYKDSPLRIS